MANNVQNLLTNLLELVESSKATNKYDADEKYSILQNGIVISKLIKGSIEEAKNLTDEEIDQLGIQFYHKLFKLLRA